MVCYIGDVFALRVGHVAQVGEDHKAREEACEGVYCRGHQAIPARLYDLRFSAKNINFRGNRESLKSSVVDPDPVDT